MSNNKVGKPEITTKTLANGDLIYTASVSFRGQKWYGVGMSEDQAVRHALSAAVELGGYLG